MRARQASNPACVATNANRAAPSGQAQPETNRVTTMTTAVANTTEIAAAVALPGPAMTQLLAALTSRFHSIRHSFRVSGTCRGDLSTISDRNLTIGYHGLVECGSLSEGMAAPRGRTAPEPGPDRTAGRRPHDVKLDILYCGICRSDIHFAGGDF